MVPSHAAVNLQRVLLFVVEVHASHLRGVEPVAPSAEESATTAKSHVVDVVGVAHAEELEVAFHVAAEGAGAIPVLGANASVGIGHDALVHSGLHAEVEHRLLLAVVDARHPRQVALLVVGLHLVNDRRGDVFHGRLGVASHELLAVDKYFLHLLAVDGNLAVVAHLRARQALDQFLDGGALRRAVSVGVILERVFLHHHLLGLCRHGGFLQHDGVGGEAQRAEVDIGTLLNADGAAEGLVAHARKFEDVVSVGGSLDGEVALVVGQGTTDEGGIRL